MATRSAKKVSLVKGRRVRVTRLDACGRVVYGDDAVVTSKGFVSVAYSANTTTSDEINLTNANGEPIIHVASVESLQGYGVEAVFGEIDPELFSMVTGQAVLYDVNGNPTGLGIDTGVDLAGQGVALELWAGAPAGDACDDEAADGSFGYLLCPFLQGGIVGDFTVENDAVSFTLTGMNTVDGNAWGKGPYDVVLNPPEDGSGPNVPGPLLEAVPTDRALEIILTSVAPPEVLIGSRPLLNPANADLVSITPTTHTGTRVVNFSVSPTPGASVGVWYDFGDGTWDYIEDGSGDVTVHTYATNGTYIVTASSNGKWISSTVTVPGV